MASPFKTFWKALTADPAVIESIRDRNTNFYPRLGGTNVSQEMRAAIQRAQAATYAWMYANQPAVRTVVAYISENLAQLGLKLYDRIDDNERESANDHPAALTMRYPNDASPADLFIHEFVSDYLVYNNAYAIKFRRGPGNPITLIRLLPHMVAVLGAGYAVTGYRVYRVDGSFTDVAPDDMIHWRNYNPEDPRLGISPLETLRSELVQESATMQTLTELAQSGLQGGYLKRPAEVDALSVEAEERFLEAWRTARKASPKKTPLLQEGMEFVQQMMSPKDAELLASRQFTRDEVAGQYGMVHCPPQGEEEHKQFYADVLAPLSKRLSCQFDLSLLQQEFMRTDLYFEFNMDEKMRGDIESRLPNLVSAAGAPIMLRDEARAILNLPKVDGGDELVTPLNVIVGDNPKPSPMVMGPQDPNKPPQDGSYRELPPPPGASTNGHTKALEVTTQPKRISDMARQRRYIDEVVPVLERFYTHQLRALQGKSAFDTERWNRELRADLEKAISSIVEREGGLYVARLGGNDFDMRQVKNYIGAMAGSLAANMNAATQRDFEGDRTAREALERAIGERAVVAGAGVGTRATFFARKEAASQSPRPEHRRQTWIANTERHAELDGVSVPLGSDWGGIEPGSEPNCSCTCVID